jgi:hypothetical protein
METKHSFFKQMVPEQQNIHMEEIEFQSLHHTVKLTQNRTLS